MIRGEKCKCVPGICEKGVVPPESCIFRLDGLVESQPCKACASETWHQDGVCIKCMWEAALRDSSAAERLPVKQDVAGSIPAPAAKAEAKPYIIVVQSGVNDKFTVPVERALALKILKMIMEAK